MQLESILKDIIDSINKVSNLKAENDLTQKRDINRNLGGLGGDFIFFPVAEDVYRSYTKINENNLEISGLEQKIKKYQEQITPFLTLIRKPVRYKHESTNTYYAIGIRENELYIE